MTSDLAVRLERVALRFSGRVGYAVTNLTTGHRIALRADEVFPTASAVKLPILTAFHEFVSRGKASWNQTVEVTSDDIPGGSGILQHLSMPRIISFEDAAWLMICLSDNLATNILLKTMTIEGTNKLIREVVGGDIWVDTLAHFRSDSPSQSMGRATPRALVTYIEALAAGEMPGAMQTLDVARHQFYRNMIPRFMPFNVYGSSEAKIANKTGFLPRVRTDIGLLETAAARVAMVFMTADSSDLGFTSTNEGEVCIGTLARVVYDGWIAE